MTVIERIIEQLKARDIKQTDFANALRNKGVTKQTITDWKLGKSKTFYELMPDIADYFGVSADYLLGRTDIKEPVYILSKSSIDKETYDKLEKQFRESLLPIQEFYKKATAPLTDIFKNIQFPKLNIPSSLFEYQSNFSKLMKILKDSIPKPNIQLPEKSITEVKKILEYDLAKLAEEVELDDEALEAMQLAKFSRDLWEYIESPIGREGVFNPIISNMTAILEEKLAPILEENARLKAENDALKVDKVKEDSQLDSIKSSLESSDSDLGYIPV